MVCAGNAQSDPNPSDSLSGVLLATSPTARVDQRAPGITVASSQSLRSPVVMSDRVQSKDQEFDDFENEDIVSYPIFTVRWIAVHLIVAPAVFFVGAIVAMQLIQ